MEETGARLLLAGRLEEAERLWARSDDWFERGLAGRAASLLLKRQVAEIALTVAITAAAGEARSPRHAARAVALDNYAVDHDLYWHGPGEELLRDWEIPLDDRVVRKSIQISRGLSAHVLLSLGRYAEAAAKYAGLLESPPGPDHAALWHAGLGCAYHELGIEDVARAEWRSAGVATKRSEWPINRARAAATLSAIGSQADIPDVAEYWAHYLRRIDCPGRTKEVLWQRARTSVERARACEALMIL